MLPEILWFYIVNSSNIGKQPDYIIALGI